MAPTLPVDPILPGATNTLALRDGSLAGWAIVHERFHARLARRVALATALLVRGMTAFRAAGMDTASLGVDTENQTGAVGLYERVGFVVKRRFVRLRRAAGE